MIRLLKMGIEGLRYEKLYPDRREIGDVDLFVRIRNGEYTYDDIMKMVDDLFEEMNKEYESSKLPNKSNLDEINQLVIECQKRFNGISS